MLLFCDMDDCMVESSPYIQKAINKYTPFTNKRLSVLEHSVRIAEKAFWDTFKSVRKASKNDKMPDLSVFGKVGSNDIEKHKSSDDSVLTETEKKQKKFKNWYWMPLAIAREAWKKAIYEKEMFLEERDHCLEMDNENIEKGIVPYQKIYIEKNSVPGSIQMLNDFVNSGEYEDYYVLSHHNGGREEIYKRSYVERLYNGAVKFMGMRFHSEEYQKGKRRGRSSKPLYVMKKFGLENLNGCVLIDDSTHNLDDWVKYGGVAILYRPLSDEEKQTGELIPHGDKYPRITEMCKTAVDEALKFYSNDIKLIKKRGKSYE